jgi:hypothetical protein
MKLRTLCSLGLMVTFFLPWVAIDAETVSWFTGATLPVYFDRIAEALNIASPKDFNYFDLLYCLYLIPVMAAITIVKDLSGKSRISPVNEFVLGLFVLILLHVLVLVWGIPVNILTPSFYLFGIFCAIGTFCYFRDISLEPGPVSRATKATSILGQLHRLYKMREDNRLSEETFRYQERILLSQLSEASGEKA